VKIKYGKDYPSWTIATIKKVVNFRLDLISNIFINDNEKGNMFKPLSAGVCIIQSPTLNL
jgi:hypothetical protein